MNTFLCIGVVLATLFAFSSPQDISTERQPRIFLRRGWGWGWRRPTTHTLTISKGWGWGGYGGSHGGYGGGYGGSHGGYGGHGYGGYGGGGWGWGGDYGGWNGWPQYEYAKKVYRGGELIGYGGHERSLGGYDDDLVHHQQNNEPFDYEHHFAHDHPVYY